MAHASALTRSLLALLTAVSLFALLAAGPASAEELAPASEPTGVVGELAADPSVEITRHRHCVKRQLRIVPRYSGGRLVRTHLFINGESVAQRRGQGALKLSAKRLEFGINSYELVSRFADGRSASALGTFTRCNSR